MSSESGIIYEASAIWDDEDACDWIEALRRKRDYVFVSRTLRTILDSGGAPRNRECSRALAAAGLLAYARGHRIRGTCYDVELWVRKYEPSPAEELAGMALQAVGRIQRDSEPRDLWERTQSFGGWTKEIDRLRDYLQLPPADLPPPRSRPRKFRPKMGDVLEIPLSNHRFAYARTYKEGTIGVYSRISDERDQPPIGSRSFRFFALVSIFEVNGAAPRVVGRDLFQNGEDKWAPPVFYQSFGQFMICHKDTHRPSTLEECRGLDRGVVWQMGRIADRIEKGENHPSIGNSIWPRNARDPLGPGIPWSEWPGGDTH